MVDAYLQITSINDNKDGCTLKLLIVVPAFNEAASVAAVVGQITKAVPDADIVVVNDGSSDSTSQLARLAGADVLDLPFNLGVGAALRLGFVYALRNGYSQVVQVDADGQHDAYQIPKLLNAPQELDVVIGSRFFTKESSYRAGFMRRSAMRWLALMMSRACRTRLTDVSSGFRLTRFRALELFSKEYPPEYLGDTVESLIIARRAGLNVGEVSVTMLPRLSGSPSQNFIKSTWYLLRASLVILLSVLHSKPRTKQKANPDA